MKFLTPITLILVVLCFQGLSYSQESRLRDYGINIGIFKPGANNAITDVSGVKVGHMTIIEGEDIRTGVTAILPHSKNIYQNKVPAAIYIGNGYGKLAGYSQVEELGNIETPVVLTNTLSVPTASNALISYTLSFEENKNVRSVNAVVGETNDGRLNDIAGRYISEEHVLTAINNATVGPVEEGSVGAGTGTTCFGYKGGIGTSSRIVPESLGGYIIGVLVQSNFGGVLEISGVPVGVELGHYPFSDQIKDKDDGSCMIVVATDAPLSDRNLKRLAKRAFMAIAKTGGFAANGSGDYVIAFSTADNTVIANKSESMFYETKVLRNGFMNSLFLATIEATEEAILNSLFAAKTIKGREGHMVKSIPIGKVLEIMKKYNKISE